MSQWNLFSSHHSSRRGFLQILAGAMGTFTPLLKSTPAGAQQVSSGQASVYEPANGDITMALAGDAMMTRALMPFREERFLRVKELLHQADVRFANSEMLFHNYENWPTASTYYSRTYMRCDPKLIKDLEWFGINMVSCANNHTGDFGQEGVLTNIRNLDEAGMVHAGSGGDYAESLAPAYMETSKGRVALLAATSSSKPDSRAGDQRRDMKGRPGANLVRWINEWTVDKEAYGALSRIANQFGWQKQDPNANKIFFRDYGIDGAESVNAIYLADRNTLAVNVEDPGARFLLGESFQRHTRINQSDLQRNVQSVNDARRMAEWVIYSVHNHEGSKSIEEPSDHIRQLAHAVIDAGADVFIGHGPHRIRGLEIYKGRPIFYSVGNLIVENDTVLLEPEDGLVVQGLGQDNTPADSYDERLTSGEHETSGPGWIAFIPMVQFQLKKLHEIKLYPIEMGAGLPRYIAGRPMLSEGKQALDLLQNVRRLSEPFHTNIEIEGELGIIRVS
jgi:poly-gamma-glutamate capsule biosynthesis protein CapA/YwtB (metallophosphatase superfamily)